MYEAAFLIWEVWTIILRDRNHLLSRGVGICFARHA